MVAEADVDLAAALRAGDETAFARLVRSWSPALLRTAQVLAGDRATAGEAVRATWLRVPGALPEYRPPPGLRAWVLGLLLAQLGVPVDSGGAGATGDGPCVARERFLPPSHPQWPGHWAVPPAAWPVWEPEGPVARDVVRVLRDALAGLPTAQRVVVGLRDVAACDVDEIAGLVQRPPGQVRELLNHGRAQLRQRLELHLA